VVCEQEGDAIFAYAPEGSFLQGQTLLETIENLYCAFAEAREQMNLNTTCTCTACTLIPTLDLKFAAHHGSFVMQQGVRNQAAKPSGPDVILVHRLLKNQIIEKTGVQSYAFFTEACAEALRLKDFAAGLQPHAERYEHLGEVSGYVYDLAPVWQRYRAQRQVTVDADHSWFTLEASLPASAPLAWDYLNGPEQKQKWLHADALRVLTKGRAGVGTTHHCVHGKTVVVQNIVDWRPFDYVTIDWVWPLKALGRSTFRLSPGDQGTRVKAYVARPWGQNALHTAVVKGFYAMMKKNLQRDFARSFEHLAHLIEEDREAGRIPVHPEPELALA
jgi:hypothetical protein